MTTFGDQVKQYGGMPVGMSGGVYAGMWGTKVYFVDPDNGLDSNTGLSPTRAKATIPAATALAVTGDTIYIRPRTEIPAHHGDTKYIDLNDAGIDSTKSLVSIIGTGQAAGSNNRHTVLRAAAVGSPAMLITGQFTSIENLSFHSLSSQAAAMLRFQAYDASGTNYGGHGYAGNCMFLGGLDGYPALDNETGSYFVADNCTFLDCKLGITLGSSGRIQYFSQIRGCDFVGIAGSRGCDIAIADAGRIQIRNCNFDVVGTGGSVGYSAQGEYIHCYGTVTGTIEDCRFAIADNVPANNMTLSGLVPAGLSYYDIDFCNSS